MIRYNNHKKQENYMYFIYSTLRELQYAIFTGSLYSLEVDWIIRFVYKETDSFCYDLGNDYQEACLQKHGHSGGKH
jgi:hypothetical protein